MSADKPNTSDYKTLTPTNKDGGKNSHAQSSLKAPGNSQRTAHEKGENSQTLNPYPKAPDTQNTNSQNTNSQNVNSQNANSQNLTSLNLKNTNQFPSRSFSLNEETATRAEI